MEVHVGWSGEVHGSWTKMDVTVDEADLLLHFANGSEIDPASLRMSVVEKFKLMYAMAEMLVQFHKISRYPDVYGSDANQQELSDLAIVRDNLTKKILERNDNGQD